MSNLDYLKNWLYHHASNASTYNNYREMLKEFEQFFVYIFDYSRDGISVLDLNFTILGVNSAIEQWYSHRDTIVGRKCYEIYRDNTRPCEDCPTIGAIESRMPNSGVITFDVPGEKKGHQELTVFPLFDDHNEMFAVVEYARNINLHKEEEAVIENLKNRLRLKDKTLHEQESALKVILEQNEKSETRIATSIVQNMRTLVEPLLDRLESQLDTDSSQKLLSMIRERTNSIASPFLKKLSLCSLCLTKREIEIAALVREGKTSKEIAVLLGITEKGVEFHRMKIRDKLGLANTKENLYSYLISLD